jgi:hypothetical protein
MYADDVLVTYSWVAPGLLAIRHSSQKCRPYILPIKAFDATPLCPPPIVTDPIQWARDYSKYQIFRYQDGSFLGKDNKRGGVKQKERDVNPKNSSHHTMFDGKDWKSRGM